MSGGGEEHGLVCVAGEYLRRESEGEARLKRLRNERGEMMQSVDALLLLQLRVRPEQAHRPTLRIIRVKGRKPRSESRFFILNSNASSPRGRVRPAPVDPDDNDLDCDCARLAGAAPRFAGVRKHKQSSRIVSALAGWLRIQPSVMPSLRVVRTLIRWNSHLPITRIPCENGDSIGKCNRSR